MKPARLKEKHNNWWICRGKVACSLKQWTNSKEQYEKKFMDYVGLFMQTLQVVNQMGAQEH